MLSPWQGSLIGGGAAGAVVFAYLLFVTVIFGHPHLETTTSLPIVLIASGVLSILLACAIRIGLLLAKCRSIDLVRALTIPAAFLLVDILLALIPLKTTAVAVDFPTPDADGLRIPKELYFAALLLFVIPAVAAYVVGRRFRGHHGVA